LSKDTAGKVSVPAFGFCPKDSNGPEGIEFGLQPVDQKFDGFLLVFTLERKPEEV
jgi:hypothetical protein